MTQPGGFDRRLSTQVRSRIDSTNWTYPARRGVFPEVRVFGRWWSVAWLGVLGAIGLLSLHIFSVWLLEMPGGQAFVERYSGNPAVPLPGVQGFPEWLRWQHYLNLMFFVLIARAGIQILADHPRLYWNRHCTPGSEWFRFQIPVPTDRDWTARDDAVTLPGWLGLPGLRHSIGLARWWHFSIDLLWVANGVGFIALLFATEQWRRLVPVSWEVFLQAASVALQYAALQMPHDDGWVRYNALQQLAYFSVVFVAAPLAMLTGLAQAPAIGNRLRLVSKALHRQTARSLHFLVLAYFLFFVMTHVAMVFATGFRRNLNHIVMGTDASDWSGFGWGMAGLGVIAALWAVATPLTLRRPDLVRRVGQALVGRISLLMEWWDPKLEHAEQEISPYFWHNGRMPAGPVFDAQVQRGFAEFRLRVFGSVERPADLSLAELRALGFAEQITEHFCIQGWTGIAKWGGTPMATLIAHVAPRPGVRWVAFYSFGEGSDGGRYYDVHSLDDMQHVHSLLAHEMNGEPLPVRFGAPLRLRCENQLGFKHVKWIEAVEFLEDYHQLGLGRGGYNEDHELFGFHATI